MDKRSAGVARYNDESGSHRGLYLDPGWLKLVSVVGPAVVVLVGMVMWFSGRASKDDVDKQRDSLRVEFRQEVQALRAEIRQDIQDMRVELRKLLRSTKEK